MTRKCAQSRERVRLNLVVGDDQFRHDFDCSQIRGEAAATSSTLLGLVAMRHHATERADQVNMLQRRFAVRQYRRADLIWSFGTGDNGAPCTRASDDRFHRQELYGNLSIEAPLHWTEVEAAYIGGACPEQLRTFLQSISDIGQPRAAVAVRTELEAFGVRLK